MEEIGLATSFANANLDQRANSSYLLFSKKKLFNNIEERILRFDKWKTWNSNDLESWLKKKQSQFF